MKLTSNILIIAAILILGLVAAIGILSMPELSNSVATYFVLLIGSKAIGFTALYFTCRLIAYFNKKNGIVIPEI